MKQCVLMQHGLSIVGKRVGVCCFNQQNPKTYTDLTIDESACRACIDQENNGIFSYRQGVNEKYGLQHSHKLPIVLDLVPNINCNLACRTCSETRSSTWAKHKQIKINRSSNSSIPDFLNLINTFDLHQVQEINFSGGEPMLNHSMVKYLQPLGEKIDFSKVILRFTTNGTHKLTDKLEKFLLEFKLVQPRFSLDDVGAAHEYGRWPSTWADWESKWQDFLNRLPHNVMPAINRTVSILNVHRLHHLEQWHRQYQTTKYGDPIELLNHFAFGEYSLDHITPEIKELAMSAPSQSSINYVKNRPATDTYRHMLQYYITQQDQQHKTSLKIVDPDLYNAVFNSIN